MVAHASPKCRRGSLWASYLLGIVLVLAVAGSGPAAAEETAPGPPAFAAGVSAETIRSLIDTIEDDNARAAFVGHLRALLALEREQTQETETASGNLLAALSDQIRRASEHVLSALTIVLDLPRLVRWFTTHLGEHAFRMTLLEEFLRFAVVIGIALAGERIARFAFREPRRAIEERESDDLAARVLFLAARTMLDLLPLAAFAALAYGTMPLAEPADVTRLILLAVVNSRIIVRAIVAIARMALAPSVHELRLLPLGDFGAAYVFVWIRRITAIAVYGYILSGIAPLVGLPRGTDLFLLNVVGVGLSAMLIVLVLQNRSRVASWLRGVPAEQQTRSAMASLRGRLAEIWHVLAIIYVLGIHGVWALEIEGGFEYVLRASALTVVILVGANLASFVARRFADRGFSIPQELARQLPPLKGRADRYLSVFHGIIRTAIYVVASLAILQAWGIHVAGLLATETGGQIVTSGLTIAVIVFVALALWEAATWFTEYYLVRAGREGTDTARQMRLRTFLPLIRRILTIALFVLAALTVLSELGINIAPLLAGAGVLGLAIGFGAQTLVKDVITGLFILLEDTIVVGDVVTVGGHSGVVESVTVRTIQLRDLAGTVHTVPFSEVTTVVNMTKDFSYATFEVGIAYREDVDTVIGVLHEVGAALQADEKFGPDILEPLDVFGLDRFGDSAVVIKARIKTRPIKQWGVRRGFNRLMKQRFDALDIEIPFPHTTVYFGVDREGMAPAAKVSLSRAGADAPAAPAVPPSAPVMAAATAGVTSEKLTALLPGKDDEDE